ncbi:hypothetical protein ABVK25_002342 [Lepraria finkii]|uniref:Uncharacterized protein n=1 Tax=Lepraria finkii TaxID=1340010 RepID=A0ABR4BKL1_9LECA
MASKPLNPLTFADSQLTLLATEQAAETSSTATLLSSTSPTTPRPSRPRNHKPRHLLPADRLRR